MIYYLIIFLLGLCTILACAIYFMSDRKKLYKDLKHKHVVVTGGSSGIGKAAAMEAAKLGGDVTVIGRDVEELKATVTELTRHCLTEEQKLQYLVLDVASDYEIIEKRFLELENNIGPIFMLINCAEKLVCGLFEKMDLPEVKEMIDLHYFGTFFPTKYVLPGMKKRKEGLIVFVSTDTALLGIYGCSVYSAAKWAVQGLAESLIMELVGTGVRLTLAFPPDTDLPGFYKDVLTRALDISLISDSAGLRTAEEIGKKLIHDAMVGKTYSVYGLTGTLMSILNCNSIDSITQVFIQIFSMGFIRIIVVGVILYFNKIIRNDLRRKLE